MRNPIKSVINHFQERSRNRALLLKYTRDLQTTKMVVEAMTSKYRHDLAEIESTYLRASDDIDLRIAIIDEKLKIMNSFIESSERIRLSIEELQKNISNLSK